jgi:hypothetical protein
MCYLAGHTHRTYGLLKNVLPLSVSLSRVSHLSPVALRTTQCGASNEESERLFFCAPAPDGVSRQDSAATQRLGAITRNDDVGWHRDGLPIAKGVQRC